jgi:hypothetical protein
LAKGDWAGDFKLPIRVARSLDEVIAPMESTQIAEELKGSLQVGLTWCGWGVILGAPESASKQGTAVAVRVEIRHKEQIVATALGWYKGPSDRAFGSSGPDRWQSPLRLESISSTVPLSDKLDDSWQVVVRGDGELALRDFSASKYWAGSFSVPLQKVRQEGRMDP